jgi:pyruvate formate lyase activating enzyme
MIPLFKVAGNKLECLLCPHYCKLASGKTGICGARKNTGNKIETLMYGVISGFSVDPVEKKPLYHFYPGKKILSVGSFGCNMSCDFCQNYGISQNVPEIRGRKMGPGELADKATATENNIGLAFTYNEPVIWFEFMRDSAEAVKDKGMLTVMVSNGYVNSEPLSEIIRFIDSYNIDLKAFNDTFYKKLTGSGIEPVKKALRQIAKAGKHLEVTTLIIDGQNDSEDEMAFQADWISGELGRDTPLHLSRYFPMYKRNDPPTSQEKLRRLFEISAARLDYVYMGNTSSDTGQNTYCPGCGMCVTIRTGYTTNIQNLTGEGKCSGCGTLIYKYLSTSF